MNRHTIRLLIIAALTLALMTTMAVILLPARAEPAQPNVVFFMLDDVSSGYMDAMPFTQRHLLDEGIEFTNGITPTALCCPSRASTLTGNLAHTTGVYGIKDNGYGGWQGFQPSEGDTIATRLDNQGYHTALVGKYLNQFKSAPANYTPPGWDEFIGFKRTNYYDWSVGGTEVASFGHKARDYSTDVLSDYAVDIVTSTDKPLFLFYSPYSAHKPFLPAPRHIGTWHPEPLYGAFNEARMKDKPKWMRSKPKLNWSEQTLIQQRRHEMLMSADEGFKRIYQGLGDEVDNTLFVFMADNGYALGDHRIIAKDFPYQHSTGVPMAVRWTGHFDPGTSDRVTSNVDLTATIAEAVGLDWATEGIPITQPRQGSVLEQANSGRSLGQGQTEDNSKAHPAYCGYRTDRYLFVQWTAGKGRELYDYTKDPDEKTNRAWRPKYADVVAELTAAAKQECSPTPPGFTWPTNGGTK